MTGGRQASGAGSPEGGGWRSSGAGGATGRNAMRPVGCNAAGPNGPALKGVDGCGKEKRDVEGAAGGVEGRGIALVGRCPRGLNYNRMQTESNPKDRNDVSLRSFGGEGFPGY